MKKRYREVLGYEEFYDLDILKGFTSGFPVTTNGKSWDFTNSSCAKRYYFHS